MIAAVQFESNNLESIKDKIQELEFVKEQLQLMTTSREQLEKENSSLRSTIKGLQSTVDTAKKSKAEYDTSSTSLKSELSRYKDLFQAERKRRIEVEEQNQSLTSSIERLESQCTKLRIDLQGAEAMQLDYDTLREEVMRVKKAHHDEKMYLQGAIQVLEAQVNDGYNIKREVHAISQRLFDLTLQSSRSSRVTPDSYRQQQPRFEPRQQEALVSAYTDHVAQMYSPMDSPSVTTDDIDEEPLTSERRKHKPKKQKSREKNVRSLRLPHIG